MGETQEGRAERQERTALASLPRVNEFADELEAVALEVFGPAIAYQSDNGADVMVLSYTTKQREHLRSVRTLIAAGLHRDALLIARTMIEGLARLLWAFNRRPERTELWLWFGAIIDWRQTLKNNQVGMFVDTAAQAKLKTYVDKHGPNYVKKAVRDDAEAAKKAGTEFLFPDDPWGREWTSTNVADMFDAVEAKYLYDGIYRRSSEWIHWGPRAMLMAMEPAELTVWGANRFTPEDWRTADEAMHLGCLSLLQSLQVLDQHFSLERTERLAELDEALATIRNESLAAD